MNLSRPPAAPPTRIALVDFIRRLQWGVAATISPAGSPEAAVVGIAVTDELELVFDTLETTRKARNLRHDSKIALVIGWDDEQTLQYQGIADEPSGAELQRLKQFYFARFPDGPARQAWPGITYFRVRPIWIRYSDFRSPEAAVFELTAAQLTAG